MPLLNTDVQAVVLGCSRLTVTPEEKKFFRDANPMGYILFARNCETPAQIRTLIKQLRDCVGREAAVLIDQEGGRVQRLGPPHWRAAPPAGVFADLAEQDRDAALEATRLNARLMAEDLAELGITIDCTPVLDVPQPGSHSIIGDRAYGRTPERVAELGRAVCEGMLAARVLPIIKHVPGHGRAQVDSHMDLPVVTASRQQLDEIDFAPFKALNDMPWAMTAHIIYQALDPETEATSSPRLIEQIIRDYIGFNGVLISDDLSMKALSGNFPTRARRSLQAGCDLVLHCNGEIDEMRAVMEGCQGLTQPALQRLTEAEGLRQNSAESSVFDKNDALSRLNELLNQAA